MPEHATLFAALLAVQGEAGTLTKDATNPVDKSATMLYSCSVTEMLPRGCSHRERDNRIGVRLHDDSTKRRGWRVAQQTYALGRCEHSACEAPAFDRHHIDGNTTNNAPSNVARYCRRHHMEADGRLSALAARARRAGEMGGRPVGITPALDRARLFVHEAFADGPVTATDLRSRARAAGIGWKSVVTAAGEIGASPRKTRDCWVWEVRP